MRAETAVQPIRIDWLVVHELVTIPTFYAARRGPSLVAQPHLVRCLMDELRMTLLTRGFIARTRFRLAGLGGSCIGDNQVYE